MPETKRQGLLYADYRGPGPLAYNLKPLVGYQDVCITKPTMPAYSIRSKTKINVKDSPGPIYAYGDNVTNRGTQDEPKYSLQSRPPTKGIEITPGPGAYNTQDVKQGVLSTEHKDPAISMGMRTKWPFKNEAPPPNKYAAPTTIGKGSATKKGAPAWGLKGRHSHGSPYYFAMKAENPGPGSYGASNMDATKRSAKCYSMQGRTQVKDYNTAKSNPGPGSYNPELPKKRGFSMGERHSLYTLPLITDLDIF